jgi:hypothetical protein
MIRWLLRFLGYISLAGGFIAFVVDGAGYVANGDWMSLQFGTAARAVFPGAFAHLESAAKQGFMAMLWDPVMLRLLAVPFFVVATLIGMALLFLGRKPKPLIGYSNRD